MKRKVVTIVVYDATLEAGFVAASGLFGQQLEWFNKNGEWFGYFEGKPVASLTAMEFDSEIHQPLEG